MTKGSRRIAVDDADVSRIQYFGDWTTDNGNHDAFSVWYGPTYEHTQHGTVADGASFSFLFNGSSVQVFGSWDQNRNETLPSWECFVDGVYIESVGPSPPSTNQNQLCWHDNIDGTQEHALTVNITVSTTSVVPSPFWFDYIVYTPYDGDLYNSTTMWLGKDDNAITWSAGWEDNGGARMVAAKGASLSAKFNGSSIRMVGPIQNITGFTSMGKYSIDGGNASTFIVSKTDNIHDILWNQTFFQSGQLSPDKEHTIAVKWDGDSDQQKFGVQNFYIVTPTYSLQKDDSAKSFTPIAVLVGGVVGGVVLLAAIVGVLWFWRRKRRYSTVSKAEFDLSSQPLDPFSAGHTFFASSEPLNIYATPYDPYAESYAGVMVNTPTPTRDSMQTSYSWASSSPSGSMSAPPTSTGFSPTSGYFIPAAAQSLSSVVLSPPPNEQSALIAMKNEQSFAMSTHSLVSSPIASGSSPPQFRKHQDSGLRIRNNDGEVVDIPPDYEQS